MGIDFYLLLFCVLTNIASNVMTVNTLKEIELDLQVLNNLNNKTNERLDRLINTAMVSVNEIRKNISDIRDKLD